MDSNIQEASAIRSTKKIFTIAAAFAAPTSVNKYTASSPTGTCAAPAPVIDNVASSLATANAAPSPVSDYVAPTPAAFYAADLSLVNEKKRLLAAALAEADAPQREVLKADATLANLNAEALLLDEEQEAQQTAKKKAKRKKR